MTPQHPLVIAHRGGSPLDIDNSAAAFEHALTVGVDMLECDLRQTRDGVLVLIHDAIVTDRGRRVVVQDATYDDLQRRLDWLLTFDEFLVRFGGNLPFNLDLKTHGYELDALAALERHGLTEQALISTVHTHSLRRLSRAKRGLRLALSRGHLNSSVPMRVTTFWLQLVLPQLLPLMLRLSGAHATMLQYRVITPSLVERLHRRGYRVFAWTVDSPDRAVRLSAAGVDGIASNDPAPIIEAFRTARQHD